MDSYVEEYKKRTPASANLFARAAKVMPGGVSHNLRYFPPPPPVYQKD